MRQSLWLHKKQILKHNIWLHSNRYSFTLLQITIYIAEFWNTITNLSMIVPALYGLSNVLRQGLERRYLTNLEHNSNQLMLFILYHDSFNLVDEYIFIFYRYLLCFVLLFITGVGSWMFHMTLLYEMQLMDELPMVWGASYFVYCQFRVSVWII